MSYHTESTIQIWKTLFSDPSHDRVATLLECTRSTAEADVAWIYTVDEAGIRRQVDALVARLRENPSLEKALPLLGVPFAVKDNVDYRDVPTTAGCPAFAYTPGQSAFVVDLLVAAGAILVGKTNLDQFATGLVGVRSPYGAVPNTFVPEYVSGGSSSGSASVTARGLVAFALGTDTAGSGRVPAGFNNLVGLKPTRGLFSARGVVPACRTLDCVSVFARTVSDAALVCSVLGQPDKADGFSRQAPADAPGRRYPRKPKVGYPAKLRWFGDKEAEKLFTRTLQDLTNMGADLVAVDFEPMHELAALLYGGPWVAERYAAIEGFIQSNADKMDPVVRSVIAPAVDLTALDVFRSEYRRVGLVSQMNEVWASVDALVVPTSPTIHTIDQVKADPIALNSQLGTYTNFVNLADWSALAVPSGFRANGLPVGITFLGRTWDDWALLDLAERWYQHRPWPLGNSGVFETIQPTLAPGSVRVAVVGAHLAGLPLNYQLTERQGQYVQTVKTAPVYRFYELAQAKPPKPGLVRVPQGVSIECELWDLPVEAYGSFVAAIPSPLGIGTILLEDGRTVQGFLCEAWAVEGARDISEFGGWRNFLARNRP